MRFLVILAALALVGCGQSGPVNVAVVKEIRPDAWNVKLRAADGVTVFGRFRSAENAKALILLFHQAGSSKDEYSDVGDRLQEAGYSSLAIDQRSGGGMFGPNETVKALGREAGYLDATRDLEAALASVKWAKDRKLPVILWGSSYSASLAFLVAAEHPNQVATLLAFSPDEYFDGKPSVRAAAAKLAMPVFVTSAQDPGEIAAAKALLDAVPARVKRQFVPTRGGVHGSSILRTDRNAKGAEEAWTAVLAFLDEATRR